RFLHNRRTKPVVVSSKTLDALRKRAAAEVRPTAYHDASRFSSRVGVDELNTPDLVKLIHGGKLLHLAVRRFPFRREPSRASLPGEEEGCGESASRPLVCFICGRDAIAT